MCCRYTTSQYSKSRNFAAFSVCLIRKRYPHLRAGFKKYRMGSCDTRSDNLPLAEEVGFEPTSHLRDYLISSQGRYDRFDTLPYNPEAGPFAIIAYSFDFCKRFSKIFKIFSGSEHRKGAGFSSGICKNAQCLCLVTSYIRMEAAQLTLKEDA